VLVVLTLYDEDVLNVEHVLTVISVSGAVAGIARSLIPDEVGFLRINLGVQKRRIFGSELIAFSNFA